MNSPGLTVRPIRDATGDNHFCEVFFDEVRLPAENLVGRAEFIFFSVDSQSPWWQVWNWPAQIRWSRLFSGIT